MMEIADEVGRLRKQAAELLRRAVLRDTPLSPEEDAEILALLKQAEDLEVSRKRQLRDHLKAE